MKTLDCKLLNEFTQQVNVDQRFDADDEGYDVVTKSKTKSKANYGGGSSGAATYTATKQFQPNPNFFNDIFNVSSRFTTF